MVYKTKILLILSTNFKSQKMKNLFFISLMLVLNSAIAQCDNWVGKKIEEDAKNNHSIYRQSLKIKDYPIAFEYWEQVFKIAPAADGLRDIQYWDGIELYKWKLSVEKDEAKKKEYIDNIISIYDQLANCYLNKAIAVKNCTGDSCFTPKAGYVYGRKAVDMFTNFKRPNLEVLEDLKKSIDLAENKSEYIIIDPFGQVVADLYQKGNLDANVAKQYIEKIQNIAEFNIKNNSQYGIYYKQAIEKMDYDLADVEKDVFDCEFFKEKFKKEFEENKDNAEMLKYMIVTMKKQECPDDDEFLLQVDAAWKKYATEFNAALRDSLEQTNPALAASRLTNEGKYSEAAHKYQQAINQETDPEKKANYLYALASIQFAHLNQNAIARSNALKAGQLKPNWGKPYILIGDMYSKSAKSCGDDWNQRIVILAALDKYYYAKSIDPSSTGQANNRINKFEGSKPKKDEGFMRKIAEGTVVNTGCWMGESVRIRYAN